MTKLLLNIVKSVIAGLCIGVLIVLLIPSLRPAAEFSIRNWLLDNSSELSFSSAVRKAGPAVVNIYSASLRLSSLNQIQSLPRGLGSGVIMDASGIVMTNYHVIKGADQVIVALQDGRLFSARLLGIDPHTDLAALYIEGESLPVIPMDLSNETQVGDIALAIGNPYNLGQTITQGIISATGRNAGLSSRGYLDFLQTDAAINAGNSGGALINSRGEMLGINTANFARAATDLSSQGISFAIPVKLAHTIMTKLVNEGGVSRGFLGFSGTELTAIEGQALGQGHNTLFRVTELVPGGPAALSGMQIQDIIVKIDGQELESLRHAQHKIAETLPGKQLVLTIYRNNQLMDISATVAELPNQP